MITTNHLKIFKNKNYSQWVDLKDSYPQFRNYRDNKEEHGYEEVYQFKAGFYLRVLNLSIPSKSTVNLTFAGEHLHICLKIKGKNTLSCTNGNDFHLDASMAAIYYYDEDKKLIDSCENDDYLMVILVIDKNIIGDYPLSFSPETLPEMIQNIIEKKSAELEFNYSFGMEIFTSTKALIDRKVNNDHLRVYLEAKSIELLCLLFQELSLIENNISLKQLPTEDIETLKLVKSKIDECLQDMPSIPQLSKEFNITESRLKLAFKSLYGLPIRSYTHSLRMQKAQQLLIENVLNIDLIAYKLGYNHTSNFITTFKQHFGMTPKIYQKHFKDFATST